MASTHMACCGYRMLCALQGSVCLVSRHTWATATLRAECFEMLSWVLGLFMWLKDFRLASKCHVAPCCPDNSWGCDTIPCCMRAVKAEKEPWPHCKTTKYTAAWISEGHCSLVDYYQLIRRSVAPCRHPHTARGGVAAREGGIRSGTACKMRSIRSAPKASFSSVPLGTLEEIKAEHPTKQVKQRRQ